MIMRIGIGLWCLQSTATAPRSFPLAYRELIEDAKLAEQVGLESLWLSEHHAYYDGYCPALLPVAAAALAATRALRIGTGVALLPLVQPARLRAGAQALHRRSGGRFELGVGMGYRPVEFESRDLEFIERRSRMDAGLSVLTSDHVAERPPMWVGVTSKVAARRAGRYGLGLMISGAFSKSVVDSFIAAHLESWKASGCPGGNAPPVAALRNVWVADTPAQRRAALDWVRSSYLVYAGLGWGPSNTGVDFARQIEASMDEVEASAIVGSADEVTDALAGYHGVDRVICRIGYDAPPRAALTEVIERIGTQVAPNLQEHTA
jgi:alkanesulfonate monooxygenase SsuD/methylene tetrahydromethanopterin reductase-like flavin-dependent oxidoreductase (luciferase family)